MSKCGCRKEWWDQKQEAKCEGESGFGPGCDYRGVGWWWRHGWGREIVGGGVMNGGNWDEKRREGGRVGEIEMRSDFDIVTREEREEDTAGSAGSWGWRRGKDIWDERLTCSSGGKDKYSLGRFVQRTL